MQQAPVDLRSGYPKLRQPGKLFPFDESLDEGFSRAGFFVYYVIAVAALRLACAENLPEFLFQLFRARDDQRQSFGHLISSDLQRVGEVNQFDLMRLEVRLH